jgi:crossover junction endodeoxyribonuclease RuvC
MYIGIDPGLDGGIAFIGHAESIVVQALPVMGGTGKGREIHAVELRRCIQTYQGNETKAFIEKVGAMPKQGVSSTFKFGDTYGAIKAVVRNCRIPLIFVTPQAWKKKVLAGLPWKGNKEMAVRFCEDRWPDVNLLKTPRSRVPHSGICDALCIAEYGRLTDATD